MNDFGSSLGDELASFNANSAHQASARLLSLLQPESLVGDLIRIDYTQCDVLVHDHLRQKVGGLPLGCFLIASRLTLGTVAEPEHEDTSLILLRVTGQSRLPNATETDMGRFLAGQRASSDGKTWDAEGKTDQFTLHQLRYAGVQCRVVGTFRMRSPKSNTWVMAFGADISNFYSGRGLKVYKPAGGTLKQIVNFPKPTTDDSHAFAGMRVPIGRVRYASSERSVDPNGENVEVVLDPTDLIARRTALFGMSRTGKSNTTKVIASSVFRIRERDARKGKVGQLIFDVNGEYANENTQDGSQENAACLKNIALHTKNATKQDVSTYGLTSHPNDSDRKIVKINFYGSNPSDWSNADQVRKALDSLSVGKILINDLLAEYTDKYIKSFRDTSLEVPHELDRGSAIRYRRAILVYRAALHAAGFSLPASMRKASIKGLFGKELIGALEGSKSDDKTQHVRAAKIFGNDGPSWDEVVEAVKGLRSFIADKHSGYANFNSTYASNHDGRSWDDERLTGLMAIFEYANGVRALRRLQVEHDGSAVGDYAEAVVDDLLAGRLVIFDQSHGDPDLNRAAAERIMWAVFNRQRQAFVNPTKDGKGNLLPPPDVLVYAEEAHNLLPAGNSNDTSNVWSRVAKEGSKYRIGLVYATQEPSSIQSNIMKNTDNWFVAHLNNSDETKELRKYYDFEDFVGSILQVPDPGFLRMRTLSNPYIVPVQVARFQVRTVDAV